MRRSVQRLVDAVETGALRPNVDRVLTLDDVVAAHRRMQNAEATGKLVIVP